MAMFKEFSNGKTGVNVMVQVNHQNKKIITQMLDRWSNGYESTSNGVWLQAWILYKKDEPATIPGYGITITAMFDRNEPVHTKYQRTPQYHNVYQIAVTKGDQKESFEFSASINDAGAGIVNLSPEDKINAFYCFIGDAIAGAESFEDFKGNFGYDDCCEAYRIHKLCKESTLKAVRLGLGDLYKVSEYLQETYPDVI
jgi:hypothetical protein